MKRIAIPIGAKILKHESTKIANGSSESAVNSR